MLNEALKRVLEREVPWNDLRQAAVLRRLQKSTAPLERSRSRNRWPLVAVVVCAAMAVAFVERGRFLRPAVPSATFAITPGSGDMLMRLPDGSTALGEKSADVKVESLRDEQADLVQTAGNVRYEVTPNPHRKFVVRVRDVRVSVLGTAFHVDVLPASVAVRVEHGKVQVIQQERRVVLESGEGITFDTTGATTNAAANGAVSEKVSAPENAATNAPTSGTIGEPASGPSNDTANGPSSNRSNDPANGPGEAFGSRAAAAEAMSGRARVNASAPSGGTPAQLLERADRARARGDLDGAARVLRELLQQHPDDTRAALAQFMLGRIRNAQGAHHEAAQAFAECLAHEASGSLAEDALAELARAHARAGERAEAVAAAQRYMSSYPKGVHQRAMRELVSESN